MPRFVILEHDHPHLHWDLLLETGAMLRAWRLSAPPATPGEPIDALALPDHRRLYLDYEGPVSGGRGTVKRWDAGEYTEIDATFRLIGDRVQGVIRLTPVRNESWQFEWLA